MRHVAILATLFSLFAVGCGDEATPWRACPEWDDGSTLLGRAAYFDQVARTQHLTSGDNLLRNLDLTEDLSAVKNWQHTENTILWSGIYLASQAFRYAVTGEAEAVENARTVVSGLNDLTRVTGIKGLYGRCLIKPGVVYNYYGENSDAWVESTAAGYEGWKFKHDVSKDGYDGLMFGYAVALEHFDDPQLVGQVRGLVLELADYIYQNDLCIVDHTGEVTMHGHLAAGAMDDMPGFNAMLSASFMKVAGGLDDRYQDFYARCLMAEERPADCPDTETIDLGSYIGSMENSLGLFLTGCKQNYDNFDMCYQAMYPLLRREKDPDLRARLKAVLNDGMFHTEKTGSRSIHNYGNSFFTFAYAGLMDLKAGDSPLADEAVDLAICTLRRFPAQKYRRAISAGQQEAVCESRLNEPTAATIVPLEEYDFDNYLWRLDFYKIQEEVAEDRHVRYSPEDFLMAYWMGRYHGIIEAQW